MVDLLLELAAACPARPVLFVTNDRMVRLIDAHQDLLRGVLHLPFPRHELLAEILEKDSLSRLAIRQGLRIPRSWALSTSELSASAPDSVQGGIPFPCIVKPATPMSSFKVLLVPDRPFLMHALARHPDVDRVILQEWIGGGDDRLHFVAYYFDRNGKVRAPFAGQKIRQVPRTLGNSSAARGVDRPDLVEEGLKLFRGLDYTGIASVEFKLAASGEPYFIEATVARSDYWLKTLIVNGVDLPGIVYSDLASVDLALESRQRNRYAWVDEDRDLWVYLESFADRSCSRGALLRFLVEPKRFALLDLADLRPFLSWWGPLLRTVFSKLWRRLARPNAPVATGATR
jgi:predicted ATP-grasp superfamily ATP-dependent carboligase